MISQKRYGFIGIIVENDVDILDVQKILSKNNSIIKGRMGLPHLDNDSLSVITLIIHATSDEVGRVTGELGRLKGVSVKSGLNK